MVVRKEMGTHIDELRSKVEEVETKQAMGMKNLEQIEKL